MSRLSDKQTILVTRAVVLLGGFGHVLSAHEAELVEGIGQRFKRQGRAAHITDNEWMVIESAVGGMEAVRADRQLVVQPARVG